MDEIWRGAAAGAAGVMVAALGVMAGSWAVSRLQRPDRLIHHTGTKAGLAQRLRYRLVKSARNLLDFRGRDVEADLELVLLLIAAELEVGTTLQLALTRVSAHSPAALAPELRRVAARAAHGDSVQALREWAATRKDPLLADLAATVEIQRETGGSLAPILRGLADMNRSRRLLEAQSRSKSAEAKISAWILALAPIAIAIYAAAARPGFLAPLLDEPLGRMALSYGIGSWLIGVFWIRTLLRGIGGRGS